MIKNLLILSGFTAFVVFLWIGLTVFHNSVDTQIPATTQSRIIPITPNFDITTLDSLKKREVIQTNLATEAQLLNDSATKSSSIVTPFSVPTSASESATP